VVFETFSSAGEFMETVRVCDSFSLGDRLDYFWLDPLPARIGGTVHVDIDNLYACGEGDPRDFWRFTGLPPGSPFIALITSATFDTLLGDYGDDGTLRFVDDNSGGGFLSRLAGTVPASGELVLAVSGAGDEHFNGEHFQSGQYTLVVIPEPPTTWLAAMAACGWCIAKRIRLTKRPRLPSNGDCRR
jgi:hypothetical protein